MPWKPTFIATFAFVVLARAYTTFDSHCSLPNSTVNYVSSPHTRGTLDIAWSCWATLIASAYSVLHLNVPSRPEHVPEKHVWVRRWLPWWHRVRPFCWCLVCLTVPEFVYTFSVAEFFDARQQQKALHKSLCDKGEKEAAKEWTLSHFFFANMGGFVLLHRPPGTLSSVKITHQPPITTASTDAQATGIELTEVNKEERPGTNGGSDQQRGRGMQLASSTAAGEPAGDVLDDNNDYYRYHLNARVLRYAVEDGLLSAQAVPEEDISDRSKFDWFARSIAMLQLTHFFVNVIARAAERLPIAPTEVAVAAFAACSIVAYGFWFCKPKDATTPIVLRTYEEGSVPEAFREWMARHRKGGKLDIAHDTLWDPISPPPGLVVDGLHSQSSLDDVVFYVGLGALGSLFGGIHLAGWTLDLPTTADTWLWRISAVVTTVVPAFVAATALWPSNRADSRVPMAWDLLMVLLVVGSILYVLCRGILIVEMIRTLFYLPPGAYLTPSWSAGIPHIS